MPPGFSSAGVEYLVAARFITPSTPFRLTNFTLGLIDTSKLYEGTYTVSLYSEAGGKPFQALALLASGNNLDLGSTVTDLLDVSGLVTELAADTAYFLVAGGTGYYKYVAGNVPSQFGDLQNSSSNDGQWQDLSVISPIYSVSGEAVPEPSTYALLGIGAVATILFRLRRKKA
jgi:hypothetical protein